MFFPTSKAFLSALYLAQHIHALPGRWSPAAPDITPGPGLGDIRARDVDLTLWKSVACGDDEDEICSVFDITYLGTFPLSAASSYLASSGSTLLEPTSVTIRPSQGTITPIPSSDSSRGPFANGTDTNPIAGATGATGTSLSTSSGTGSPLGTNGTTVVLSTSTLTLPTTTYVPPAIWTPWTNGPHLTGTDASSGVSGASTSCSDAVWSNQTSSRGTGAIAVPSTIEKASASEGTVSNSFKSTATYTFAMTTVELPVPESYTGSIPQVVVPTSKSDPSEVPASYYNPSTTDSPLASTISFTRCSTTTKSQPVSAVSGNAAAASTLVCWGLNCNAGSCSDFLTHYPLAANTSTTTIIYPTGSEIPNNPEDVWPSITDTNRNSAAYTSTPTVSGPPVGTSTQVDDESTSTSTTDSTSETGLLQDRFGRKSVVKGMLRSADRRAYLKAEGNAMRPRDVDRAERKFDVLLEKKKAENDKLDSEMLVANGRFKKM